MAKSKTEFKPIDAPSIDTIKDAKARKRLAALCTEYRELADQAAALDAAKSALMDDIKAIAEEQSLEKVAGAGWLLSKGHGGRSEIKAELLLQKGVKMAVIEACTVEKKWSYFQVLARPS